VPRSEERQRVDDDNTVELHARTSWGDILIRRPSSTPAR